MLTRRSALAALGGAAVSCDRTEKRPNLVFLMGDDHRWDVMGGAGNALAQTPNLDRLAAEGARFEKELRDAHGTPELVPACRAYRDQVGTPHDPALLSLFLDTQDAPLVIAALERLLEQKNAGSLEIGSGLRSQLRVLAEDRDDAIAGISEELLDA